MKLTDEKILNTWRTLETKPTSVCVTTKDILCFARAILKEAGVEELERDAERWQYDLSTRYEQHLRLCKHVNIAPDTFEQFTAYACEANDRQREQIDPNKK